MPAEAPPGLGRGAAACRVGRRASTSTRSPTTPSGPRARRRRVPRRAGLAGHSDADVIAHASPTPCSAPPAWATSASTSPTPTLRWPAPTRSACWAGRWPTCGPPGGRRRTSTARSCSRRRSWRPRDAMQRAPQRRGGRPGHGQGQAGRGASAPSAGPRASPASPWPCSWGRRDAAPGRPGRQGARAGRVGRRRRRRRRGAARRRGRGPGSAGAPGPRRQPGAGDAAADPRHHAGVAVGRVHSTGPAGGVSSGRTGLGGDQVEGRQAVRELLIAGRRPVREVWMVDDRDDSPILDRHPRAGRADARVPVTTGRPGAVRRPGPVRGAPGRAGPGRPAARGRPRRPRHPPGRTAAVPRGAGRGHRPGQPGRHPAVGRVRRGDRGDPAPAPAVHVTPAATKAAAGAIEHVPMAVVGGLPVGDRRPATAGVHVVGLDGAAATSLYDMAGGDGPVCLVLGAEGRGLSRLVRERCDEVVAIPMAGVLGLAQRVGGRRPRLLRGRPAPQRPPRSRPRPDATRRLCEESPRREFEPAT